MKVNVNKTGVIHFRKPRVERTNFVFSFDSDIVQVVDRYKYLGLVFHEYLDFNVTSDVLAEAGGRALGAVYNQYKRNKGFG